MGNKYKEGEVIIRRAKREDMVAVADMIQELADFEKMPDGPQLSVEDLQRDGFERAPPSFRCLVAQVGQAVVGYALYFPTYSTWRGRSLQLEDLCVRAPERRRGLGRLLFNAVAKEAKSLGSCRLDFHVLEWNPARAFYESAGARDLTRNERWCYFRLADQALDAAAQAAVHIQ